MRYIALSIYLSLGIFFFTTDGFSQDHTQLASVTVENSIKKLSSDDDATRFDGLQVLTKEGPSVLSRATEMLKNQTGYSRVYLARLVLNLDSENSGALQTLSDIAKNKQEKKEVRRYASYVLALSPSGIDILSKSLQDDDLFVRRSSAFALEELIENGSFLPPGLISPLYKSLTSLAIALADDDSITRGVAAEAFVQVLDADIPALNEAAKSSNFRLKNAAKEMIKRRREAHAPEGLDAEAKIGFEEQAEKSPTLLHGSLGLIRAFRLGGEPVRDYRSIRGADSPRCLHLVLNPRTRKLSSRLNDFNPYEDL